MITINTTIITISIIIIIIIIIVWVLGVGAAELVHEAGDHAVEVDAVVEARLNIYIYTYNNNN